MTKYEHVVYSTGYTLKVDPPDRGMDVMHHLITGGLLGGRSLDGVTWEKVEDRQTEERAAKMLSKSMRETLESR